MNFDKLRHFSKIYEAKSLSRASDELGLSKTALSLSLKSLEKELSLILFNRSNKAMLPTGEGDFLYHRISPLLIQIGEIRKEILSSKKDFSGIIRIGAPICFGSEKVSPYLDRFLKLHPAASIDLILEDGEGIKRRLDKGELDFAIVGDDVKSKLPGGTNVMKIFEYELILCCSSKLFDENFTGKRPTRESIEKVPFVNLKNVPTTELLKHHFSQDLKPPRIYSINNHHVHISQLLNSKGIGIQSKYSVQKYLTSGRLIELRPSSKKLIYSFYAVQFFSQVPSRILKELIEGFQLYLKEFD